MLTCNHIDCQTIFFARMMFFCYEYFMNEKKMFATRIYPAILKELKHLSIDAEKPISELTEEAIQDLLKKYEKKGNK
jgi:hypothetical protein